MCSSISLCGALLLLVIVPTVADADWPCDSTMNVPVCVAAGDQLFPVIASDSLGGAILAWVDYRSGGADIYAQRVTFAGSPIWTIDGVPICTVSGDQTNAAIVADGRGGAIVAWTDYRSGHGQLYAQHVNADGVPLWETDGRRIGAAESGQDPPSIANDGNGGALLAWRDGSSVCAQHLDGAGSFLWPIGRAVSETSGLPIHLSVVADGAGGAIVSWETWDLGRVYTQRIGSSGAPLWDPAKLAVTSAPGQQYFPTMTADGAGGAIVAWSDTRNGVLDSYGQQLYDIYAQRLSSDGDHEWTGDGVTLCTQHDSQVFVQLVTDGASGAIACWQDHRGFGGYADQIYAQRVDSTGATRWASDGIPISTNYANHYSPVLVSDGTGGAIMTWFDGRSPDRGFDIYAQHVDESGNPEWTADGAPICAAMGNQWSPAIAPDGGGGAVVTWYDERLGMSNADIYAQQVPCPAEVRIALVSADATPVGVTLHWRRAAGSVTEVTVFSRQEEGDWVSRGNAEFDSTARLRFEDRNVSPGTHYSYRLSWNGPGKAMFSGEATVSVPVSPRLALHGAVPNPAVRVFDVAFSLPGSGAATLELIDLAGRRLDAAEVGGLGAGFHSVVLGDPGHLRPGVYWIRLRRSGQTLTQRAAMLK